MINEVLFYSYTRIVTISVLIQLNELNEQMKGLGKIIKIKRVSCFVDLIKRVANELLNRYNPTTVVNLIRGE